MHEATRRRKEAEAQARLDAHIKKVVDSAPPLTPERRDRLALLLRPRTDEAPNLMPSGGDALTEMMGDE